MKTEHGTRDIALAAIGLAIVVGCVAVAYATSVSVVYHQEVTNRTEQHVVYRGPSVEQVRRALETVLSDN